MKHLFFIGLILVFVGFLPVRASVSSGVSYLQRQQASDGTVGGTAVTAWAVMALQVSGAPNSRGIDSLKQVQYGLATKPATDVERQILALVAVGQNPRTFVGVDAVAELKKRVTSTQIGSVDLLTDDIFGILALRATNESVSTSVVNGLISSQNNDGGWGIYKQSQSSSDITALALISLKPWLSESVKIKAETYLRSLQNDDGGFATSSGVSNTASTAWALWWINTSGGDWSKNGHSPSDFLWSKQNGDGSWDASVLVTSYALLALSGKSWPILTMIVLPTPTPTPTPTATPSPTPTSSSTPSPTPTSTPVPSSSLAPVSTSTPTSSPASQGKAIGDRILDSGTKPGETETEDTKQGSATPSEAYLLSQVRSEEVALGIRDIVPAIKAPDSVRNDRQTVPAKPPPDPFVPISGFGIMMMTYAVGLTVRDIARYHP